MILRALILACSWTWCIGMWFPVYLCRDFGWPGWVAFAVPNVIGAASVGFVLRGAAGARAFAERHGGAMAWFGVVTVAFHLFFVSWLLREVFGKGWAAEGGRWGFLAAASAFAFAGWRRAGVGAAVVFGVSLLCAIGAWATGGEEPAFVLPPVEGAHGMGALAMAAPAIAMGFLLCPYLDLTIVRVREECGSDARARGTFALGFGVFFLGLIAMTLGYAGRLIRFESLSFYIVAHILAQSAYTLGLHVRAMYDEGMYFGGGVRGPGSGVREVEVVESKAIATQSRGHGTRPRNMEWALLGLAVVGSAAGRMSAELGDVLRDGYPWSRFLYEMFMCAYGLVFPAYVWVWGVLRARSAVWLGACVVLAAPMFWFGYIEQRYVWLVPGVLVVIGAGVAARAMRARGSVGQDD